MLNKTYWKANTNYETNGLLLPTGKNVYNNTSIIAGEPIDKTIATSWYKTKFSTFTHNDRSTITNHKVHDYKVYSIFSTLRGNLTVNYNYAGSSLQSSGSGWDVTRYICGIDTSIVNIYVPVYLYSTSGNVTISATEFINNFNNYKDYKYCIVGRPVTQENSTDFALHFIIESPDLANNKAGGILQFSSADSFTSTSSYKWNSPTMLQYNLEGSNTMTNTFFQNVNTMLQSTNYPRLWIMPYVSEELTEDENFNSYEKFSTSFEQCTILEKSSGSARGCWSPTVVYELLKHVGIPLRDTSAVTSDTKIYIPLVNEYGYHSGEWVLSTDKKASESSLYKTKTDTNTIDDTKEPLPPDADDTEKMTIGGYYTAGGLVNYYSLVNTPDYRPLDLLSGNLSNWDYVETGKDVLKNLVSLKAFPIERSLLTRGTSKEITIAGTQTGVNGQTVDSTYSIINLGSVHIPNRYNDFRDYAPYTKIEVCIPFVSWVQLPSHCMGHDINISMTYDIITGSCTVYVILDDNTIVAQACGCIAYDIPFTADAVGMKTAGMINGILGITNSALSLGTGLVSGNIVGSASGIIGLANSVTQTICANNSNYTEVRGTTGDSNNFAGVKKCYLKITYPISHVPDNYGKTVGYLYNKPTTLTSGMGYTKTSNTKIHGDMLESEKMEIINLMENGVIL